MSSSSPLLLHTHSSLTQKLCCWQECSLSMLWAGTAAMDMGLDFTHSDQISLKSQTRAKLGA